jgi:hypothetical protein
MYPTLLLSLVCGTYLLVAGNDPSRTDTQMVAAVFLAVFAANMLVFSFDFPRTTSLTLVLGLIAVALGVTLAAIYFPALIPALTAIIKSYHPWANASFYFSISAILSAIFVFVWIHTKLDYWEVTPNELLHHHGLLSDLKRMSAPNLRLDKEVKDLFEYMLLRSGRLVIHPSHEPRAIVLENVLFIDHKERALKKLLGALQVQVRPPAS